MKKQLLRASSGGSSRPRCSSSHRSSGSSLPPSSLCSRSLGRLPLLEHRLRDPRPDRRQRRRPKHRVALPGADLRAARASQHRVRPPGPDRGRARPRLRRRPRRPAQGHDRGARRHWRRRRSRFQRRGDRPLSGRLMQGKLVGPEQLELMKTSGFWSGGDPTGCGGVAYGHSGGGAAFKTNVWVSETAAGRRPASERPRRCRGRRPRRSGDDPPLLRRRRRGRTVKPRRSCRQAVMGAPLSRDRGDRRPPHRHGRVHRARAGYSADRPSCRPSPAGTACCRRRFRWVAQDCARCSHSGSVCSLSRGSPWRWRAQVCAAPTGRLCPRASRADSDRTRFRAALAVAEADGRRYIGRSLIGVAAVLGVYWVVLPVGIALMATHRPREAAETVDLGRASQPVTLPDLQMGSTCAAGIDVAQRRRRDRLSRQRQPRGSGARAHPPRLRRADARHARLREQRQ